MTDQEKVFSLSYLCGLYRGIISNSEAYVDQAALKEADKLLEKLIYNQNQKEK